MLKNAKISIPFLVIVFVVLVAAVILRKTTNSSTKPSQSTETDGVSESLSVEDKDPSTGSRLGLPAGFPKDFPVYPEAEFDSAFSSGEEVQVVSALWTAKGSVRDISEFYKSGLEKQGWKLDFELEDEESITFSINKDDTLGFVGVGKGESNNVIISVTIGAEFEKPLL